MTIEAGVAAAVARDLAEMALRAPGIDESTLAAAALELARQLDDVGNSATSKSMCARSLIETMDKLRELAPPEEESDALDDLAAKRAARLARRAAT